MRRVLFAILGVILALLILVPGGGYLILRRSLPQTNGTVTVSGLQGAVDIVRDADGVPYIYAQNDLDAMFGLGYVHAQDRLWQMEFQRRVGAGRLSEVLGESTVDTDKFLRTLGTYRAAEQAWNALSPQAQQVVQAYVSGANAYLASKPALPIEFTILGFSPAPWQPADCLVWAKMMAWNLGGDYESELVRAQIYQALGPERAAQLFPPYPDNGALIVPNLGQSAGALAHLSSGVRALLGADALNIGSNNWVVSGSRTTTSSNCPVNVIGFGLSSPISRAVKVLRYPFHPNITERAPSCVITRPWTSTHTISCACCMAVSASMHARTSALPAVSHCLPVVVIEWILLAICAVGGDDFGRVRLRARVIEPVRLIAVHQRGNNRDLVRAEWPSFVTLTRAPEPRNA